MQDFHYNYIKDKYGDNAEMLLTDSDSLMCNIEAKIFMKNSTKSKSYLFDFNNYPKNPKY